MIDGLNDVVEQLAGLDIESMPDAAVRAEYIELMRARDRIEHRRHGSSSAIHRRGIPFENGASSTPAWVQWQTGQRRGEARASLEAGLALETLPLTAKAWAQGEISASAAPAICEGRPNGHEAAYGEVEETLVGYAADRNWRDLRAVIAHVPALRRRARRPRTRRPQRRAPLARSLDRWALRGDLDDLGGTTIDTAMNAAMDDPSPDDLRSPSKRRADALVEICRYFLDHGDLPMEGGEAPHISVAITWDAVATACTATRTSPNLFGPSLSPEQLAELLCDCKTRPRDHRTRQPTPRRRPRTPHRAPLDPPRRRRTRQGLPLPRLRPKTPPVQGPPRRPVGPRRRNQRLQLRPALQLPPRRHPQTRLDQHLRRHHLHRLGTRRHPRRQYLATAANAAVANTNAAGPPGDSVTHGGLSGSQGGLVKTHTRACRRIALAGALLMTGALLGTAVVPALASGSGRGTAAVKVMPDAAIDGCDVLLDAPAGHHCLLPWPNDAFTVARGHPPVAGSTSRRPSTRPTSKGVHVDTTAAEQGRRVLARAP